LFTVVTIGMGSPAYAATVAKPNVTVEVTSLPGLSIGAAIELTGQPLWLLAGAIYSASTPSGWAVCVASPVKMMGFSIGPLVGFAQNYTVDSCIYLGIPGECRNFESKISPGPVGIIGGLVVRYDSPRWWLAFSPAAGLLPPLETLPPDRATGLPPEVEPPVFAPWFPNLTGLPLVEYGWRFTPNVSVVLRTSLAPLGVAWTF
jgi:hypothetical protein